MKIAFVDLGRHYGGIELYILSLAKAWKERGNKCLILARRDSTFYHKLIASGFTDEVIPVSFDGKSVKEARKRIAKEQVDVFHVNGINSGVFVSLLRLPVKRVTTVHGSAVHDRTDRNVLVQKLFVWLENQTLKKSQKIISVSAAIKDMLVERGMDESRITVVYNGIRELTYDAGQKQDNDVFRICFVGRLEKVKGCEYLIRALTGIKERNYQCDIYGDGSLKEQLEQLSKELQVDDKIVFKGFADNIREVLNQYDILVQPSLYEAFPLTLLEVMNARTLILCSDVGGMKELITDYENGLKFQVGNTEELAEDIVWAMEHPEEVSAMKEKAFAQFESEYTEAVMYGKTFRLLESVFDEV